MVSNISCCVGYRESMVPPVGEVFQLEGRNHHDYFVVSLFCSWFAGWYPTCHHQQICLLTIKFDSSTFFPGHM